MGEERIKAGVEVLISECTCEINLLLNLSREESKGEQKVFHLPLDMCRAGIGYSGYFPLLVRDMHKGSDICQPLRKRLKIFFYWIAFIVDKNIMLMMLLQIGGKKKQHGKKLLGTFLDKMCDSKSDPAF